MALPGIQDPQFEKAVAAVGFFIKTAANTATARMLPLYGGAGVPTDVLGRPGIWVRNDPSNLNEIMYLTDGATWDAVESVAADAVIDDTNTYYTVDTINGALDALALQLGGLTDATFGFAENNVLADNDALYAALEKLDLKWGDLASVANTEGASLVGAEDAAAYYAGAQVEAILTALGVQIGGLTDTTFGFAENNVLADNDPLYAALEKLDLRHGDLASTANTEGASLVGVEDAAGFLAAADVEAALAELAKFPAALLADPGDAAAIPVTRSATVPITTGAGGETGTLAIPTFLGQEMRLVFDVDGGGDRVITVASAINVGGNTIITFATARQMLVLKATQLASALAWEVTANVGTVVLS